MTDDPIWRLGVHELSEQIRTKALSPVELASALLDRIEELDSDYRGFITVTGEQALAAAKTAEAEIASGNYRGPLHGIPYGAKDIFNTAGVRTTMGTKFYSDFVPTENADAIDRLEKAGAILIGKCNTHEFAAGSTTINQYFGTARNPWNRERIVGGSSGGSAVVLAACMAPLTLGSDTGGSIRTPAALCGAMGLKPTAGRVSLRGIYPNTPTLDHAGPMARSVRDLAHALQVIAGYDPLDPESVDVPVPDYMADIEKGVKGARIIVSPDFTQNAEADEAVATAFERAIETFAKLGAKIETRPFPEAKRFDDIFRDISGPEFAEVHRKHFGDEPEAYDEAVGRRVEWSLKIPLDDYVRALRQRELLIREIAAFMEGADAMISPAVPCVAPPIATKMARINGRDVPYVYLHRPFQSVHNLTGMPAMAMPMGFNEESMPVGLQIVSGLWREADVLRVARAFELATPEIQAARPPTG